MLLVVTFVGMLDVYKRQSFRKSPRAWT